MFSVGTSRRVFFMHSETEAEMNQWIHAIKNNIEKDVGDHLPVKKTPTESVDPTPQPDKNTGGFQPPVNGVTSDAPPRARLAAAKNCIPYLLEVCAFSHHYTVLPAHIPITVPQLFFTINLSRAHLTLNSHPLVCSLLIVLLQETSKVLEFWQIWTESVPLTSDLQPGMSIEFQVATSADMQKLTWRTAGPQNIFIQKMVDFFWNVGAPESEIDRLNDVGALINPIKIGSWIDMSARGGMDGGWYFPVDIPLKLSIEASDAGDPTRKVSEWAEQNNVSVCFSVGRGILK